MTINIKHKIFTYMYILCVLVFVLQPTVSNAVTARSLIDSLIGKNKQCNFVDNGLYKPFSDINNQFPVFGRLIQDGNGCINVTSRVPDMVNTAFKIFLSIISLIAVVNISIAGIKWITQDKSGAKTDAREKLTNAIIGLVLALSSWLVLNTVNPRALDLSILNLQTGAARSLTGLIQTGINQAENNVAAVGTGGCIEGVACAGGGSSVDPAVMSRYSGAEDVKGLLNTADNATKRSLNGGLNLSLYSSEGDNTTDSGTRAGRGNNNNLLTEGSIALSPDLVDKFKAQGMQHGQEIKVNGTTVGYWDDTTGDNTDPIHKTGTPIVNTIDIYNPNNTYGNTNSTLKTIPAGGYQITLGSTVRPQTRNP